MTPQDIGEVAASRVRAAAGGADAMCLGLISQDGTRLEWITAVGFADELQERFHDLPLTAPAAATDAVRTGRPVIIATREEYERRYPGQVPAGVTAQASSGVTWPLRAGTAQVGGHQPARILGELALITEWATSGKYATMVAAIISPDASQLTYATAGHPPILIRRARTGAVEIPPPAAGPPLCLVKDDAYPRYTQSRVGIDDGDIILMYTDGLIERRGEDPSEGIARIAGHLQAWPPGLPLGGLCDQLTDSLAAAPQLDDMCVLAVRRRDPPDGGRQHGAALRRGLRIGPEPWTT